MINMINVLYISNLFINLLLTSKLKINELYIIIKDYTI